MPMIKHLSIADCRAVSERLEQMRQRVLDELRAAAPTAEPDGSSEQQEVHSHADQAEATRRDDVRFAEIEVDRSRLHDIEQAQQRMAQGRYGVCVECGEDIPGKRLLAQPTAVRCAACQSAAESRRRL